jgi:tetratricopeptide (TPR) repeat protein
MKKILIALILVIVGGRCVCQGNEVIDPLITKKVDSLVLYTKSIWYNDTDAAKEVAAEVLHTSRAHSYEKGEARGYNLYGVIYDILGDYDKSLTYYKESFEIFLALGDSLGLADCQYNIGVVLQNDEQFSEALRYVENAYSYYLTTDLQSKIAMSSMTLGNLYLNNDRNFDEGLKKIKSAVEIAAASKDTTMLCYALSLQGDAYVEKSNFMDSAVYCFNRSIRLMKIKNKENHWSFGFSYLGLAKSYLKSGQYEQALLSNQYALNEYKILNQKLGFRNTYKNRKDIFEQQGDFKEAVNAHNLLKIYSDSIYSEQQSQQINRMKTEYETEKKEAEIASLSQQAAIQSLEIKEKNQAIAIGLIVLLLVVLAIYFLYRQRSLKNQQAQTELEQRFLRSQLNPHFISNALMAVQNFMLKNQTEKAATYLAKFSKLMREILENSRQEFILVEDEIEMLRNYMDIHKLRMNDAFDYKIIIDENIDPATDTIPPMFVQPFVENAIEYGVINAKGGGLIELSLVKEGNYISIAVKDNGKGLSASPQKEEGHTSLSTTIIKERMALFNKSLKNKIQLLLGDYANAEGEILGTKVELKVPFSYL